MEIPKTTRIVSSNTLQILLGISVFSLMSLFFGPVSLKSDEIDKAEGYNSISTEGSMASRFLLETGEWRAFYKEEFKSIGREDEEKEQNRSFGLENSFFLLGDIKTGGMLREISTSNAYTPRSSVFSQSLLSLNIDPRSYGTLGYDVLLLPETALFPSAHVSFIHSPEEYLQGCAYLQGELKTEVPGLLLGVTLIGLQTHLLGETEVEDDWWYNNVMPPLIENELLHLGGRLRWGVDANNGVSLMNTISFTPRSPPSSYTSIRGEMKVRPYNGAVFDIKGNCQLWDRNFISTRGDRPKWAFNGGVSLEASFFPRLGILGDYQFSRGFHSRLWRPWVPGKEKIGAGCFLGFSIIDISGMWNRESDIEEDGDYSIKNELYCAVSLNIKKFSVETSAVYTWEKEDFIQSVYKLKVRGDSPVISGKGNLSLVVKEDILLMGRTSWELALDPVTVKASIFTLEGFRLSGEEEQKSESAKNEEKSGFFDYVGIELTGIISYDK